MLSVLKKQYYNGLKICFIAVSLSYLTACSQISIAGASTKVITLNAIERTTLDPIVKEISGLASTKNKYWGINDSGGEAALYSFDKMNKGLRNVVKIENALNIDWEDLAQDEQFIYIADSGNNIALRQSIDIYKISKQELIKSSVNHSISSKILNISYADQDNFLPLKTHNFDSEALTAVNGKLWLFSKNRKDQRTKLYKLDKTSGSQSVAPVASYPVNGLITAVDYNPQSQQLIFLGYSKRAAFGHSFIWVVDVKDDLPVWNSAIRYKLKPYAQWEAIKWTSNTGFIAAAEKSGLMEQGLATFKLP
jgi:hypothetical protein